MIPLRKLTIARIMAAGSTPGSGNVRIVTIALLSLPLAGCYGILVPKPLPDWAMRPQVEPLEAARIKTARIKPVRDTGPGRTTRLTPNTPEADVLPFTPEWQAREDAFDERLRRTMNICRGC